ncbi:hypothetical protein ACUSIJ_03420 [Pseudochelatococcus sp. B33]
MARSTMSRSPARARAGKNGPAGANPGHAATPGRARGAQEAIAGFIRTLEKLDAAASRPAAGPTQNKAAPRAPEGKFRAPEGK